MNLTIGTMVARSTGGARRGLVVAEDGSESEPRWRVLWEGSLRPQWEYTEDLMGIDTPASTA